MSSERYFAGIDVGTQGVKIALVADNGHVAAKVAKPLQLLQFGNGHVEQDPNEIFQVVLAGLRQAVAESRLDPKLILGIGVDGQMAGVMGIDQDWNPATPYDSWLDTRSGKYMPMMKRWSEERIIQLTGCPVTYAHGPKIVWWKHERPDIYQRIDKFVTLATYISGRFAGLRGEEAYIDYTHLHFTGFADTYNSKWSSELVNAFEIEASRLPRIVNPWDVIGKLTPENAAICGLLSGTPIVAGCGDTAASTFGSGIVEKGMIFDVAGTASILTCCVDEYCPDTVSKTLIYSRSVVPGLWTPLAYINGGGQCIEWYKDLVGGTNGMSLNQLERGALQVVPGSDGLVFAPHFAGRVCPNNSLLRGSWVGLSWHHNQYSMYRSILESIAYEYKCYLDTIKSLVAELESSQVLVIGGGSKSRLFNQIKSDVLNLPYVAVENSDTAPLGCSIIAGYGLGYYDDLQSTVHKFVRLSDRIEPSAAAHEQYLPYADLYNKVLDQMSSLYVHFPEA